MSVSGWEGGLDPALAVPDSGEGSVSVGAPGSVSGGVRSRVVAVRVSEEEYGVWKAAAAGVGREQVGRWVRETVARALDERPGLDHLEGVEELRVNLSRAGSNLNQVARALNFALLGAEMPPAIAEVVGAVEQVRAAVAGVRDALHEASR